jgi:hypothetical protein
MMNTDDFFKGEVKPRNPSKIMWQHPMRAVISGSSGTGKTGWLLKALADKRSPFDRIIWCAPSYSLQQPKLLNFRKRMGRKVVFVEGLDEALITELMDEGFQAGLQQAVVLDDLMYEQNDFVNNLFTSGRHKNVSTIELTQRLFTGGRGRINRLNTNYFVLFPFGDKLEMTNLAKQINPSKYAKILEAYETATSKPFGALIIDKNYHALPIDDLAKKKLLNFRDTQFDVVFPEMSDV